MTDRWFRWEREASIHLLFPTLEVFYQPLFKYCGISAPTMVLVFQKGVVSWCIREDEFMDYGRKLLAIYSNPRKERKMVDDIKKSLQLLKKAEKDQEKLDLVTLSDSDLIMRHQKLYQAFIAYYTMGAIGTPLSFAAESDLKLKGLSAEQLNALITPEQISYISKADEYLLKHQDIPGFIKQYFWINNSYSGTGMISESEVKNRLSVLVSSKSEKERKVSENVVKVELAPRDRRLIELLKHYAVYKDHRKKEILIFLHYLDTILREVVRRVNLDIEEVRSSCPFEVEGLLGGKLSKKQLDERLKYCVIVWEAGKMQAHVLTGSEAKKWEQKTRTRISGNTKIIQGMSACLGKVKGRVRILLKAEDCGQIKKGEVLVTFMTSPDFMPAIRKCSAIVTNLGGVTSHAAIISRELGIPCIVGTKVATQVLKNGDMVEVDANIGNVRII